MSKNTITYILMSLLLICLGGFQSRAQSAGEGIIEFESTTHNFGDVLTTDGPLTCTFRAKNISDKPIAIYSVTTSCGCTNVKFSKEPIACGASTEICATYNNEDGPFPFEKTLTVYVSGVSRPIILYLRGNVHEKKKSLSEMYPLRNGPLGWKTLEYKCGNLLMGESRSDETSVANLSQKAVRISFADLSDGLQVKAVPETVPAGGTARIIYTVSSQEGVWGKNWYNAKVCADGKPAGELRIFSHTAPNFSSLSKEQKLKAPRAVFETSTYSFGRISSGTKVKAEWNFSNGSGGVLQTLKVDVEAGSAKVLSIPSLEKGQKGKIQMEFDTTGLPKGEACIIVTLTMNSPQRPIVNLFIVGWID